jgi:3-oxoacyl-[acyl-carrier protein] reductase/pteridine reductase
VSAEGRRDDRLLARPLAGKRALVTGGAKRIGRALALTLAEAGADVAVTYRGSAAEAEKTVAELRALGVRALAVVCDVGDEASVQAALAAVVAEFGGLDVLVNNAGAFETAPLEEISVAQWDAMFATNTRGPFLVAKAAHAHLKAAHGRIVNIGSLGGIHPWATHGHYCTSKAALHMLSHTMAKAWAPEISVNCVAPGMIVFGEVNPAYESFARKTPMQRNGRAEDVAAAVLFFATGPHFITGQMLVVDGGLGL